MGKVIELSTWEEFQKEVGNLFRYREERKNNADQHYVSDLIFRGQSNSEWNLTTTLERDSDSDKFDVREYFYWISNARPEVEAFTEKKWGIPDYPNMYDGYRNTNPPNFSFDMRVYEYITHLRHHGFTSPLLDWSLSPYVAAYFAFAGAAGSTENVAIYAFMEYAGYAKTGFLEKPIITNMGHTVSTHRRHFLQRCEYTFCSQRDDEGDYFVPHDLALTKQDSTFDKMWKFILPISQKKKVLEYLDMHNITEFTLFGSEDSLMRALSLRYSILGKMN